MELVEADERDDQMIGVTKIIAYSFFSSFSLKIKTPHSYTIL